MNWAGLIVTGALCAASLAWGFWPRKPVAHGRPLRADRTATGINVLGPWEPLYRGRFAQRPYDWAADPEHGIADRRRGDRRA